MTSKVVDKKKRFVSAIMVTMVIFAFILSTMAFYNSNQEFKQPTDGETSLIRTGALLGVHGCEEGGFSIQTGIDSNFDGILADEEVNQSRNVCHGQEGLSGPMGARGHHGINGTNGSIGADGINGTNGTSPFIQSLRGAYGPCPDAVVIEMGNDTDTGTVESSMKLCFSELYSGRLTDIRLSSGDSFSTPCNGLFAHPDFVLIATTNDTTCELFRIAGEVTESLTPNLDFYPGANLGFIEFEGRIYFDGTDANGTQLWSTDGQSLLRETSLVNSIQNGDRLIIGNEELILSHGNGLMIFGDSLTTMQGEFSNLSIANGNLVYNSGTNIHIGSNFYPGEIHSHVIHHLGHDWFIATTDSEGPELHRHDGNTLVRVSAFSSSPTEFIGLHESIIIAADEAYVYDIATGTISLPNTAVQMAAVNTGLILHDDRVWFDCTTPTTGNELCVSDGESLVVHYDLQNGLANSLPRHLTIVENRLVVIVEDPIEGSQLYEVQEDGMSLLWDHESGDYQAVVHGELWVGDGLLYMIADSPSHGLELYGWAYGELTDEWIVIY